LAGAPPPQLPARLGLKDLREIQARPTGTGIETATETETKTTTEMQAGQATLPHAQQDNILIGTTMEDQFASGTKHLQWYRSELERQAE
jgi:hypothetical protein